MTYKDFGLSNTKQMLTDAHAGGYAVPGYNFSNMETLQAIIRACEKTNSPVILQVSQGSIKYTGMETLIALVKSAIHESRITNHEMQSIALHLDHGADFEICKAAIDAGFSSVMIDASDKPFDENVRITRQVVEYAKQFDVSVEAELGALAGIEDDKVGHENIFTKPDEAARFVELTGIDSLAISIGTSHGAYKGAAGTELKFDLLKEITDALPGFPLVLHGASSIPAELVEQINKYGGKLSDAHGIPTEQLIRARGMGICKINVDSDARLAFTAAVRKSLNDNPAEFDPRSYLSAARDKMMEMYVDKNISVMGSGQ